jgi:manganese efflux pump family protein
MSFWTLLIIAVGLSMDSFAVSLSCGLTICNLCKENIFKIAGFLAISQTIMPIIGWLIGFSFRKYIESYDHWFALGLLSILGLKMIYEGLFPHKVVKKFNPLNNGVLLTMCLATTIDALVIGISFALLHVSIIFSSVTIGIVTFIFSATGILIGNKIKSFSQSKVLIAGGLILIGIGIKILLNHIYLD